MSTTYPLGLSGKGLFINEVGEVAPVTAPHQWYIKESVNHEEQDPVLIAKLAPNIGESVALPVDYLESHEDDVAIIRKGDIVIDAVGTKGDVWLISSDDAHIVTRMVSGASHDELEGKVDKFQGYEHAGMALHVDDDGNVIPQVNAQQWLISDTSYALPAIGEQMEIPLSILNAVATPPPHINQDRPRKYDRVTDSYGTSGYIIAELAVEDKCGILVCETSGGGDPGPTPPTPPTPSDVNCAMSYVAAEGGCRLALRINNYVMVTCSFNDFSAAGYNGTADYPLLFFTLPVGYRPAPTSDGEDYVVGPLTWTIRQSAFSRAGNSHAGEVRIEADGSVRIWLGRDDLDIFAYINRLSGGGSLGYYTEEAMPSDSFSLTVGSGGSSSQVFIAEWHGAGDHNPLGPGYRVFTNNFWDLYDATKTLVPVETWLDVIKQNDIILMSTGTHPDFNDGSIAEIFTVIEVDDENRVYGWVAPIPVVNMDSKVDKDQGTANVSKFLVVNSNGLVEPTTVNIPDISTKVDKQQGANNAGKVLGINASGLVTPVDNGGGGGTPVVVYGTLSVCPEYTTCILDPATVSVVQIGNIVHVNARFSGELPETTGVIHPLLKIEGVSAPGHRQDILGFHYGVANFTPDMAWIQPFRVTIDGIIGMMYRINMSAGEWLINFSYSSV